jgi:sRNA-binding protein
LRGVSVNDCADLPVNQSIRYPCLHPGGSVNSARMDDEGGVLGNLPRSRPGTRSQKRDAARTAETAARTAETAARAAETAERRSAKAARPADQSARRPQAPPKRPADGGPDPVGGAVRLAAGIAGTGLRVANGVTREVLRRLPRP